MSQGKIPSIETFLYTTTTSATTYDFGYDHYKYLRLRLLYHLQSCFCQSVCCVHAWKSVCLFVRQFTTTTSDNTTIILILQQHTTDIFFKFLLKSQRKHGLLILFRCYNSILRTHSSNFLLKSQQKHGLLILFRCYKSILWTYFSNLLLNFQRKHGLLRTILAI